MKVIVFGVLAACGGAYMMGYTMPKSPVAEWGGIGFVVTMFILYGVSFFRYVFRRKS